MTNLSFSRSLSDGPMLKIAINADFELLDIAQFNLPLLDEPMPATSGQYSQPHTGAWSAKIASFDWYFGEVTKMKADVAVREVEKQAANARERA
jgi:hypothetical protein